MEGKMRREQVIDVAVTAGSSPTNTENMKRIPTMERKNEGLRLIEKERIMYMGIQFGEILVNREPMTYMAAFTLVGKYLGALLNYVSIWYAFWAFLKDAREDKLDEKGAGYLAGMSKVNAYIEFIAYHSAFVPSIFLFVAAQWARLVRCCCSGSRDKHEAYCCSPQRQSSVIPPPDKDEKADGHPFRPKGWQRFQSWYTRHSLRIFDSLVNFGSLFQVNQLLISSFTVILPNTVWGMKVVENFKKGWEAEYVEHRTTYKGCARLIIVHFCRMTLVLVYMGFLFLLVPIGSLVLKLYLLKGPLDTFVSQWSRGYWLHFLQTVQNIWSLADGSYFAQVSVRNSVAMAIYGNAFDNTERFGEVNYSVLTDADLMFKEWAVATVLGYDKTKTTEGKRRWYPMELAIYIVHFGEWTEADLKAFDFRKAILSVASSTAAEAAAAPSDAPTLVDDGGRGKSVNAGRGPQRIPAAQF